MHWTPDDMDQLERTIVEGGRIRLSRRGTEYVVVPREIHSRGGREALVATTQAGDELEFMLDELDDFDVI